MTHEYFELNYGVNLEKLGNQTKAGQFTTKGSLQKEAGRDLDKKTLEQNFQILRLFL